MVRVGTFPLTQERRRRRTISNHRIFQKQAKNALFLALLGSLALFARKPISFFAWLAISNASQFASSLGLCLIGGKPSEPRKPVKLACSLPTSGEDSNLFLICIFWNCRRSHAEVTHIKGQRIAAPGIGIWNPAFDVTPAELITKIITEKGNILPGDLRKLQ